MNTPNPNLRNDPNLAECESKDSISGILDLNRIELGITEKGIKFAHLCSKNSVRLRPAIREQEEN